MELNILSSRRIKFLNLEGKRKDDACCWNLWDLRVRRTPASLWTGRSLAPVQEIVWTVTRLMVWMKRLWNVQCCIPGGWNRVYYFSTSYLMKWDSLLKNSTSAFLVLGQRRCCNINNKCIISDTRLHHKCVCVCVIFSFLIRIYKTDAENVTFKDAEGLWENNQLLLAAKQYLRGFTLLKLL